MTLSRLSRPSECRGVQAEADVTRWVNFRSILATNDLISVAFISLIGGASLTGLGVGRFYNSDIGPMPLTIVLGLRARVNPVGMAIAKYRLGGRQVAFALF